VRYSAQHKAQTRNRIVAAAGRRFNTEGLKGAGVADVMKAADLTHGGFYGYFSCKDELVAETVRDGLDASLRYLKRWGDGAGKGRHPLHAIIDNYLSALHRDNVATGCPLPALGADVARGDRTARSALAGKLREILDALAEFAAAQARDGETVAIGVLSGLVGGMVLARATGDAAHSERILAATAAFLKRATAAARPRRRRGA
jgi:TetR/AcrR family transcriptional repressor of nem operon